MGPAGIMGWLLCGLIAFSCPAIVVAQGRDQSGAQPLAGDIDILTFQLPDTIEVEAPAESLSLARSGRFSVLSHSLTLVSPDFRSRPLSAPIVIGERVRTVELSRFACTAHGADRGANLGLWLGGLGRVAGLWDDAAAFYLMGAGAAVGALWGGTAGYEEPGFRIRVEPTRDVTAGRRDWPTLSDGAAQ